ncbi:MAG: cell division protein FtsW [Bacteroidetes bacterium]|nr:cell division protein FtsW [Bacteroidota bacterium]
MNLFKYIKGDKVIWTIVVLLSLLSILVVYSSVVALAYRYKNGDTGSYLIKHIFIVGSGIFLMYLVHKVKYSYFSRISQIAVILAAPLLLYTLIKGVSAGEAARWLSIPGTSLTFQTSDFAKLALITYVARMLSIKQDVIKDFKQAFLPIIIPVGLICLLILPANFSTAALLFLTCLVLMFIGRMNTKHLLILVGSGLVFGILLIVLIFHFPTIIKRGETWKARIENFRKGDSESNFQAEQAKIAIATGGVFGLGPGHSMERNFLPQAASDFIYAIVIEEWGLLSAVLIVFLYVILLFRGVRIANKSERTFGSLLAIGLTFSLVFQAMINMAVAVNLFPVTGQPLPLVSMGGTSIWFTSISLGIILSVSRETETENKTEIAAEKGGALETA